MARLSLPAHTVIMAPLSEVVAVPHDSSAFEGAKGVILTSANAVPMLPPLPGVTAWCVGGATARAAREAGFETREGGGDAAALIALLLEARPEGPLIHAHGVHLARDVAGALREAGLMAHGITVYEARARDWPPAVMAAFDGNQRVIAPLFSPRAAAGFVRNLNGRHPPGLVPIAISPACAAALPEGLRRSGYVAPTPDAGGMLHVIAEVMSQGRPLA
jgi:uroporphyrinogen-III synthase